MIYSIFFRHVCTWLSPNDWQYTGTVEAGKCFYSARGPPLETCSAQSSAVYSVYTSSAVYMSQFYLFSYFSKTFGRTKLTQSLENLCMTTKGLEEMFEADFADMYAEKFPLVSLGCTLVYTIHSNNVHNLYC